MHCGQRTVRRDEVELCANLVSSCLPTLASRNWQTRGTQKPAEHLATECGSEYKSEHDRQPAEGINDSDTVNRGSTDLAGGLSEPSNAFDLFDAFG